jgi:hypothetical protein
MLTQQELDQVKAALDMLNPDDCVCMVYPNIIDLLKTFTERTSAPGNCMFGGSGTPLNNSCPRNMSAADALLCKSDKTLIEDKPIEGGSLS